MRSACFYAVAIAIAVVDQASKSVATARVPFGSSMPLLGGPICIAPTRNPGGAFGLFQSWAGLLTVITVAAVVVIVLLTRRGVPLHPLAGTALALQLGGALGNLVDRLRLGYVLDFIDVQVWPVFNIADSAITLGVLLLVGYLIFCDRKVPEPSLTRSGTVKR